MLNPLGMEPKYLHNYTNLLIIICFQIYVKHERRNGDIYVSFPSYVEVTYRGFVIRILRKKKVTVSLTN